MASGKITRRNSRKPREPRFSADSSMAPSILRMADRKSTRLNSSHTVISYAVFCLKKKKKSCTVTYQCKPNESDNSLSTQSETTDTMSVQYDECHGNGVHMKRHILRRTLYHEAHQL